MSIFKKFSGKDDSKLTLAQDDMILDDILSDELPPVEPAAVETAPEDLAKSIHAELDLGADDMDDIEDLVESAKFSMSRARAEEDAFDLQIETYADEDLTSEAQWVEPYVDARGVPPVTPASITPPTRAEAEAMGTAAEADEVEPPQAQAIETFTEAASAPDDKDDFNIPPVPRAKGMNLSELRLDIVRITSDIESGEALYRRAQQRVDSLMSFIEQAEVAVSTLQQMEPENRRLLAENRGLETDVEAQRYKLARLESELESQQAVAQKANAKTEALRAKLTEMNEALNESHGEVEMLAAANDELKIQAERVKTSLEIETRENITLREKLTQLSDATEKSTQDRLGLQKSIDSLTRDLRVMQDRNNTLDTEKSELGLSLRNAERQNVQMREELVEIQEKIVSYKSQHEAQLHRRDDKIVALLNLNAELEKTLKSKEDTIDAASAEIAKLRKSSTRHDMEREKLERTIAAQTVEISKADEAYLQSRQGRSRLDQRYDSVAEALSLTRRGEFDPRPEPTAARPSASDLPGTRSNLL